MKVAVVRSFLAVLDHEGYQYAAEHLGGTASALHKDVKSLERELGVTLFVPVGRMVQPTADALSLALACRNLVAASDEVTAQARQLSQGTGGRVRVGCVPYHVGRFLALAKHEFVSANPGVEIEFVLITADIAFDPNATLALALRGEVDLAFGMHGDEQFEQMDLWEDKVVVATSDAHPLRKKKHVLVEDLAHYSVLACTPNYGSRRWLDLLTQRAGVRLDITLESTPDALLGAALVGLGVGVFGDDAISRIRAKDFALLVDENHQPVSSTISVRWLRDRVMPKSTQMFLDFLHDNKASINNKMRDQA